MVDVRVVVSYEDWSEIEMFSHIYVKSDSVVELTELSFIHGHFPPSPMSYNTADIVLVENEEQFKLMGFSRNVRDMPHDGYFYVGGIAKWMAPNPIFGGGVSLNDDCNIRQLLSKIFPRHTIILHSEYKGPKECEFV